MKFTAILILSLISFYSSAFDLMFKEGNYICSYAIVEYQNEKKKVSKPTTININKYGIVIDDLMGKDLSEYYSWEKFHKLGDFHLEYKISKTWSLEIYKGKAVIHITEYDNQQKIELMDCHIG